MRANHKPRPLPTRWLIILITTVLLTGCGTGAGSGSNPCPAPKVPVHDPAWYQGQAAEYEALCGPDTKCPHLCETVREWDLLVSQIEACEEDKK